MSDFERQLLLAHLRGLLTDEAHVVIRRLVRDGVAPTAQTIKDGLLAAVGNAKPRSRLVPWFLPDGVVERMAAVVADAVTRQDRAAA